jgi:hypothetical protein
LKDFNYAKLRFLCFPGIKKAGNEKRTHQVIGFQKFGRSFTDK